MDSARVDHRVDIYSLGCTLFFLLAGRPMYSAGSLMALLLKHRDAPIPSLSEARSDVPAELDEIYRRMAAKRPEHRYCNHGPGGPRPGRGQKSRQPLRDHTARRPRAGAEGVSPTNVTLMMGPAGPAALR